MSLTSFLNMRDVKDKVKPLRPKLPRKIVAALQAKPRSNRYTMVGTAFDYLLRFELQRRAPHAVSGRWVAEYAPERIWRENDSVSVGMDILHNADPADYLPPEEIATRARAILDNAKAAIADYVKVKAPTAAEQADLASHAIRVAKLDSVYRARRLEPSFEEASPEDIQDLVDLLAIVPFGELLHDKLLLLNPNFGETSNLVGGADADLITGDLLVDFKVTKKGEMNVKDLDQLLGYFLMARHHRREDAKFPEIKRVALYFCRHTHLWELDVSTWIEHPEFPEIEEWFFNRAKEVFGPSRTAAKT